MRTRLLATVLIATASVLVVAGPAQAAPLPTVVTLEIQGPDGVFVPVASGAQFAVSSTTPTVARWTLTNAGPTDQTGYYLYSYGPDCLVSALTIAAGASYVCTETIDPPTTFGPRALGALAGLYDGIADYPIAYPLVINGVDDTNGQSFTVSTTTVKPGDLLTISGVGFDAADALTASIGTQNLGAISGSSFSQTVTIPAGTAPGVQTVTLYSNGVAYAVRSVTVLGPALAATGSDTELPLLASGALLIGGLALALVRRRRIV